MPAKKIFDEEEGEPAIETRLIPSKRVERAKPATNGTDPAAFQVLGACLLDEGPTLDRAIESGLTPDHFHEPTYAFIFSTLARMRVANIPIGVDTLVSELGPQLPQAGGVAGILALSDPAKIPTTARAGYHIQKLLDESRRARLITEARARIERLEHGEELDEPAGARLQAKPLIDFQLPARGDKTILLGNRYLSRGDIGILASTSGMGKSSLSIQAATCWALGRDLFGGFRPNGPLKSLFFQSEDSEGDVAEVRLSLEHAMKLTPDERQQVRERVLIVTDRIHRGLSFRAELKRQLEIHQPDIVWINPLLAFLGGDVNDSTDVGTFLREQLNSLNEPARFAYLIIHHTAKPPKEKKERQWNEVQYEMAGSAELTNAARAIISLQAREAHGEFNLILPKRGQRAGVTKLVPGTTNPELKFEQPTIEITIRHSKEHMDVPGHPGGLPVIYWERFEPAPASEETTKAGRPTKYHFQEFREIFPTEESKAMGQKALLKYAYDMSGIKETAFRELLHEAVQDGELRRIKTPGGFLYYQG